MFSTEDTLPDPKTDKIGKQWLVINSHPTFTHAKRDLITQALSLMKESGYIEFPGQQQDFLVSKIGDS